jgi:5-formyltetrahydrofolate cyclo-ligase
MRQALKGEALSTKEEIRSRHRQARSIMPATVRAAAASGIAIHGLEWASRLQSPGPSTLALYLAAGLEPPTLPLIMALHEAGNRILLPVCEPDRMLSWVYWTPSSDFRRSRFAPIQEPVGERHGLEVIGAAEGIFVPATAVDRSGNRIGQGGGYYDNLLAQLEAGKWTVPTVAVVYDSEVLPAGSIPSESFDRPVRAALTPSGLIQL